MRLCCSTRHSGLAGSSAESTVLLVPPTAICTPNGGSCPVCPESHTDTHTPAASPAPTWPPPAPAQERRTQLFSATMTSKVAKLQRACLRDPAKVEVASKYSTVDTLRQQYMFVPAKYKDCYLIFLLNGERGWRGWGGNPLCLCWLALV